MAQWNGAQQANASAMQGIGSAVGMLAMLADGGKADKAIYPSTPGEIDYGEGDGSGIDDKVHIMASTGEYIIPADVVKIKGEEFFDRLVDKYHTPAAQQRKQMAQGGRSALPVRN